jgi:hypothetical protein
VVLHLNGGRLFKGTLASFSPTAPTVQVRLSEGSDLMEVSIQEVKAIFYVRSFTGHRNYKEKRKFGMTRSKGKRIMIRFKDGEILCGYSGEDLARSSGTLLLPPDPQQKGFFVYPADPKSNNTKVFVISGSLLDVQQL